MCPMLTAMSLDCPLSCSCLLANCSQTPLNYLAFHYFDIECTWWRLFQNRVVCTKFDITVFLWLPIQISLTFTWSSVTTHISLMYTLILLYLFLVIRIFIKWTIYSNITKRYNQVHQSRSWFKRLPSSHTELQKPVFKLPHDLNLIDFHFSYYTSIQQQYRLSWYSNRQQFV